ncbi:uncharacterized protein LOC130648652 [Hydractinia symbiolongicarpus]|uniref:uncharacterized protein LOC130648637 n=1 Tax=Hydractinia symbiolongicarpus TaxID=13093 RepID=UPI00254ACAFE|nr:uncharacterized protein LOC130648637 [Hydractinia symbiolongicarpus]XP_057310691.1 uncharacterized protein LOC130648652 [Hydractinia symbiolongicarpus]
MRSAKIQCSLWILWRKPIDGTNEFIEVDKVFHSNMTSIFQGSIVDESMDTMFAQIRTHVENPALPKSGFMVIINPDNNDQECFKWSIIAAIHHEEIGTNHQRISKLRPYQERYNWDGIEFPTSIKDITKFERNNPDIAVNVLYATGKKFNILRRSAFNESDTQVNLLLLTDEKRNYYVSIKNLSKLLGHHDAQREGKMVILPGRTMPSEKEKWLYYQDGHCQFKKPFVIYAEFESLLIPVKNARDTKTLNKHVPCGWATYSTFAYGEVPDPLTVFRGKECVTRFVDHLEDEVKRLYSIYPQKDMLLLTEILKKDHDSATSCHISMKPFDDDPKNRKVKDHCHSPGLHRGAAHNTCNLKYKIPKPCTSDFSQPIRVPIAGMGQGHGEKYKKIEIRLIDTCCSMASLKYEKLANNLNDEQCKYLRWFFAEDDTFKFMRGKGVYPYEYMDGWRRFEETELPPKEAFHSKLNMKGINNEEYEHAQKVWNAINPKGDETTMGDYHDAYLVTDVLLLTDIFQNFHGVCHANYGLDPAHFYSAPGLAWKAALKYTV